MVYNLEQLVLLRELDESHVLLKPIELIVDPEMNHVYHNLPFSREASGINRDTLNENYVIFGDGHKLETAINHFVSNLVSYHDELSIMLHEGKLTEDLHAHLAYLNAIMKNKADIYTVGQKEGFIFSDGMSFQSDGEYLAPAPVMPQAVYTRAQQKNIPKLKLTVRSHPQSSGGIDHLFANVLIESQPPNESFSLCTGSPVLVSQIPKIISGYLASVGQGNKYQGSLKSS